MFERLIKSLYDLLWSESERTSPIEKSFPYQYCLEVECAYCTFSKKCLYGGKEC